MPNNNQIRQAAAIFFAAVFCLPLAANGNINIVGSSTVYPFSTVAAERFAQITGNKAPKVEATGSGGGLQIFCGGTADITNASRRIKPSEQKLCATNGAGDILEIKIGYDGIVIGQAPDITNASRRIKPSEQKLCATNGAGDILEIKIGYDGSLSDRHYRRMRLHLRRQCYLIAVCRQRQTKHCCKKYRGGRIWLLFGIVMLRR